MDNKDRDYPVTKNIEQYSLLRTFIAGKLESQQNPVDTSKYWSAIVEDVDALIKADPEEAFNFAVKTLEPGADTADPPVRFREWWQGTALIILADSQLKSYLVKELDKENEKITKSLESFLNYRPVEFVKTKSELPPEGFNLLMAMNLVNNMQGENVKSLSELEKKSHELLNDEQTKIFIDLFHSIPEDQELIEPLYQIIHSSTPSLVS